MWDVEDSTLPGAKAAPPRVSSVGKGLLPAASMFGEKHGESTTLAEMGVQDIWTGNKSGVETANSSSSPDCNNTTLRTAVHYRSLAP